MAFGRAEEDGTLVPSSRAWGTSGTGGPIGCLTLNMSEWTATLTPSPSDGVVSSLSDILEEPGGVPERFFLSRKACTGILRRAAAKGKALPPVLKTALERVAATGGAEPEEPEEPESEGEE
jgi:hypothetical protein